jgi:hypothetical protein
MISHIDQLADDIVVRLMWLLPHLLGEIAAFDGEMDPTLRLCCFGLSS